MTDRKTIVCFCMLCALAVSAVAAQGATALEVKGTTLFTCKKGAGKVFNDEHCKEATGGTGTFAHVAIGESTTTELSLSNETTASVTDPTIFKYGAGGFSVTVTATATTGSGTITNKKAASGEHYVHGEFTLTHTGVTANHNCKVYTDIDAATMGEPGVIHTEPLTATTEGQGMALKIQPKAGNVLERFYLTECELPSLNGTYSITGSFNGVPNGATVNFSHAETTAAKTLFSGGTPVGIEGTLTLSGRLNNLTGFTPVSFTTVET